ncbi:ATP-binding protein [Streptomyces sp. NPDC058374]|uniref:ATP-binding protein n=1 Tax=Streptomyces sp. NPDC058374 TaxID=3346466 RepID=UPI00365110B9
MGEGAVLGFEAIFLPGKRRAGEMRRLTAAHLHIWGLGRLAGDVTLVVSELVTNAIEYGEGSPVGLRVTRAAHELCVEVTDGNPEPARSPSPSDLAENGRGLLIVAALAQQWDVSNDGKTTWCRFHLPAGRAR